ncbi:MAG: (2Fe-2S)-binding protein [Proteobacteria bacterium]|nr:(2Fe-2S)-binding protein [Pseudomonadota bacterium]
MASTVTLHIDGRELTVPMGSSVAAALASTPGGCSRLSVSGEPRAPFCGMGICHECRVSIDGRRQLACQTLCRDGMRIDTATSRP